MGSLANIPLSGKWAPKADPFEQRYRHARVREAQARAEEREEKIAMARAVKGAIVLNEDGEVDEDATQANLSRISPELGSQFATTRAALELKRRQAEKAFIDADTAAQNNELKRLELDQSKRKEAGIRLSNIRDEAGLRSTSEDLFTKGIIDRATFGKLRSLPWTPETVGYLSELSKSHLTAAQKAADNRLRLEELRKQAEEQRKVEAAARQQQLHAETLAQQQAETTGKKMTEARLLGKPSNAEEYAELWNDLPPNVRKRLGMKETYSPEMMDKVWQKIMRGNYTRETKERIDRAVERISTTEGDKSRAERRRKEEIQKKIDEAYSALLDASDGDRRKAVQLLQELADTEGGVFKTSLGELQDRLERGIKSSPRRNALDEFYDQQFGQPAVGGTISDVQIGETITNHQTGERLQWDGVQWVPPQQ
jgi:hypothetical protein